LKILVAGCAGFIGSHLSERLLAENHEIIGLDNFSPFYDRKIKERNLSYLINHDRFTFYELDILNKEQLFEKIPKDIELIVNLASRAGVRPSIEQEEIYLDVNIKGNLNLLQLSKVCNCKKYFFASSSSIYGNNISGQPSKESENSDKPISPYAFTKRAAELMNYYYHELYNIDIINARFFTVYGPRQRPDLAIHKFIKLLENDQAIEIYGDGKTSRDYTYIDDIVDGIIKSIAYLKDNQKVYETVNLGNSKPLRLDDLVNTIAMGLKLKPKINYRDFQEGDVNHTNADISHARKILGYDPRTDIKAGILKFISWYKSFN
tara:strand:- start:91 stop:1050 length:960 start_codon:yes stop_codon:yes gene_type:complete